MTYIGDFALEKTFDLKFTTVAAATGAPTTLAGTPVVSAYVDNSTTEITAGITLTVDFDARTGLHNVRVVATAANGYAAGSNYQLVLTAGTVGGTSVVGYVIGSFSIQARSGLRPTTADRTLDVTATGAAGIDWANVENPTTAVNLSATNIDVDQIAGSVAGLTAAIIHSDLDDIQARLPAALVGGRMDSSVGAVANDAITAASLAADASTEIAAAVNTVALVESYRANGAQGTLTQLLYEILAHLTEASIAGTTKTVKKIDHTTVAATATLDNATAPTSITRAT